MKKSSKFIVGLLLLSMLSPISAAANENVVVIGEDNQVESQPVRTNRSIVQEQPDEPFEAKTTAEREQLPQKEQEIINRMEQYLKENSNPNARNFGPVLNKLIASLAFDATVRRENTIFSIADLLGITGTSETSSWFENVAGKSERYITVFDEPTQTNLKLHSYYVDNQSDKTAVVHHGYRSNSMNIMEEAQFLYELGYNVIIPDARSHGKSEGTYIAFGAYERNDINAWINQELEVKPNQKIVLLGVSMGAATVMMSQETPHPNVEAVIEDCGYYSIEQQARDVMRLITSKLQYIPLVNKVDWYNCENELIDSLNNQFVKPILKVDLFSIAPLNSVSKSNVPKLFIHGSADWFIPPVAKDKLYTASLGYKDQLTVPNAGHAVNLKVGGNLYKDKVSSFLKTVNQMKSLRPQLAEDKNLLFNTEFKRNTAQTSFDGWKLSNNGSKFNSITASNPYEFVLKKSGGEILSALSTDRNGLKFYKKRTGSAAYAAQEVSLTKNQPYELSFDAYNPNPKEYSEQVIKYGFGNSLKQEKQIAKNKVNKKIAFTPQTTGPQNIILGSEMTYSSLFGRKDTVMYLSNVKLINTDRTAPEPVKITQVSVTPSETFLTGQGEPETLIQVVSTTNEVILEVTTDSNGYFNLAVPKQQTGTLLHMVNKDLKGNTSASIVLVSN
ncbi:alpha/beta fold hydrolase [Enterococcus quebecensis]|uniref:Serine aminopeptidase S33 domain-containing protein n=1 Tax=Enterococcus quebecensis TaxID=903983 RepID=A0A1E5GV00_9ENTE|nr:alpha/beta hydrolase [Enterococcus quebecensis]OEG16513.1 hypothetical protein BCR23_06385 [Enterococcus quebecensis]OJG74114.1 hypothetical protein RV12_GL002752 [Enterococcus quebecensis]